jgi:predicted RNA binding protein YcfA (HicA-like mRNA interferase family)
MTKSPLKNIPIKTFRDFLKWENLYYVRTNGGHEIWSKKRLSRPVTFQTHIDPVPEKVVRQILKTIGSGAENYIEFLNS